MDKPINHPERLNMNEIFMRSLEELAKPYPSMKLKTWDKFNTITGGFRPREFTILCGPTGAGKTQLLASLSAQLIESEIKHFVMSVETGATDYMKRVMSSFERENLNTGEPVPTEKLTRIAAKHMKHFSSGMIEFALYEDRLPVEQLIHDLSMAYLECGCKLAIIDNLNFFMEVTSAANQVVEMDRVIHELIIFCKKVDMHIIMVMHPKKTEHGRVESEFDIKGSSTSVQEAHNVFLFNRPKKEDIDSGHATKDDRELKIAKMRRRGSYIGSSLWFSNINSAYLEKGIAHAKY